MSAAKAGRARKGSPATMRFRLVECPECGCKARVARVWLVRCAELGRRPSCVACGAEASCPDVDDAALYDDRALDKLVTFQAHSDRSREMAAKRWRRAPRQCRHDGCSKWVSAGRLHCDTHDPEGMPF